MKTIIRKPDVTLAGEMVLRNIPIDDLTVTDMAVMAIDGSTTNTGVGILRKSDGALFFSCSFAREDGESPVRYKINLKRAIDKILTQNRLIDQVYYEEPFIGYASSVANLMMLRVFIEELIIEREPFYDYLKHSEINNKKWKKLFLAPDKCPTGTELEKAAVRKKLEGFMPFLREVTQDEIDAISMGFIATVKISKGEEEDLESKKKIHPFQYNMKFFGADDDQYLLEANFTDIYDGPKSLLESGVSFTTIKGPTNFDKHVYNTMGQEDKILIVKFPSNTHGDLILKYKLGYMAASYDYIYAIIWRKVRKG
jgi:hypothetical protein